MRLTTRIAGLSHVADCWDHGNRVDQMLAQVRVHVLAYIATWPVSSGITEMETSWVEGDQPGAWVLRVDLSGARDNLDLDVGSPVRETFLSAVASLVELSIRVRWSDLQRTLQAESEKP